MREFLEALRLVVKDAISADGWFDTEINENTAELESTKSPKTRKTRRARWMVQNTTLFTDIGLPSDYASPVPSSSGEDKIKGVESSIEQLISTLITLINQKFEVVEQALRQLGYDENYEPIDSEEEESAIPEESEEEEEFTEEEEESEEIEMLNLGDSEEESEEEETEEEETEEEEMPIKKNKPSRTPSKRSSPSKPAPSLTINNLASRTVLTRKNLESMTVKDLKALAKARGKKGYSRFNKSQLLDFLTE
jgi:hypothetical protein